MSEQPDVSLLLKQLREDEQRLVRLRHNQNVEGTLGTVGKGTFDFPMPGAKPHRAIPTPPQRRGGGGASKDHELGSYKVPVAPHLLEATNTVASKKKFFPPIPLPPLSTNLPKAPTPRLTPSGSNDAPMAEADAENSGDSPRSVSRGSSRASSRQSSSSRMTSTPIDPERFERLEQMLVEERAGRLEMLDKVNALSRLLADQNKKIVDGRRRARFMKR
jgi:hypothetical protein